MEQWSRKYDECQNCGTQRYPHKAKGYCTRCYKLRRKLHQAEMWNPSDTSTLKGFPLDTIGMQTQRLERIKRGYMRQISGRLEHIRIREEKLSMDVVEPIDVEYQLQHIARRAGVRDKGKFHGVAGFINDNFPLKERKALYYLLNEIEEGIPKKDINYHELLFENNE